MKTAILLGTLLSIAASDLTASTVRVDCRDNPAGGVTLSYTVTAEPGETIKDFHLISNARKKISGTGNNHDNGTPGDTRDDWTWKKGGGSISWWTPRGGITAGNSLTFTMTVPTVTCATLEQDAATWVTTSNGGQSYKASDIVDSTVPIDPPIYVSVSSQDLSLGALGLVTQIGRPTNLLLRGAGHIFQPYAIAASFGDAPGIQLTPNLHLPLNPDPLFLISLMPSPLLQNFQGVLQPPGIANAAFFVPPEPLLIDLELFFAALTLDPVGGNFLGTTEALVVRIGN